MHLLLTYKKKCEFFTLVELNCFNILTLKSYYFFKNFIAEFFEVPFREIPMLLEV